MQGIGAEKSQEEAKAELRSCSEKISRCRKESSRCNAYNLDSNKIEPVLSHCSESPSCCSAETRGWHTRVPRNPNKKEKKSHFWGVTARGDVGERETEKIPIFLEDSHQDWRKSPRFQVLIRSFVVLCLFPAFLGFELNFVHFSSL